MEYRPRDHDNGLPRFLQAPDLTGLPTGCQGALGCLGLVTLAIGFVATVDVLRRLSSHPDYQGGDAIGIICPLIVGCIVALLLTNGITWLYWFLKRRM